VQCYFCFTLQLPRSTDGDAFGSAFVTPEV